MNKIKTPLLCLLILFFILMTLAFFKIKKHEEFRQKLVLAHEIHKALGYLMVDLSQARADGIKDVPADGLWHKRGAGYFVQEGHLFHSAQGSRLLIADDIAGIFLRRQVNAPGILEVRVEARHNVSLTSNLRIRIRN